MYEYTQFYKGDEAWENAIVTGDVERPDHRAALRKMNELGEQGWELVFITVIPAQSQQDIDILYTMRRLRTSPIG